MIPQVPEGTAHYKCAPLPIRVNPPLSKSRCGSKASVNAGGRDQIRTGGGVIAARCLTRLGYPASGVSEHIVTEIIATSNR